LILILYRSIYFGLRFHPVTHPCKRIECGTSRSHWLNVVLAGLRLVSYLKLEAVMASSLKERGADRQHKQHLYC